MGGRYPATDSCGILLLFANCPGNSSCLPPRSSNHQRDSRHRPNSGKFIDRLTCLLSASAKLGRVCQLDNDDSPRPGCSSRPLLPVRHSLCVWRWQRISESPKENHGEETEGRGALGRRLSRGKRVVDYGPNEGSVFGVRLANLFTFTFREIARMPAW